MERIQGIENMSCEEITATLSGIMSKAEEDAKTLRVEIEQAYTERGQIEKTMKDAAAKKDLDAYKEARSHFNFLTDFIAGAEKRADDLEDASLIDDKDFLSIKRKMNVECFNETVRAVDQIVRTLEHIDEINNSLSSYIASRNSALIALAHCAREKDRHGEKKSELSLICNTGSVVESFAENLKEVRRGYMTSVNNLAFINFSIFYKDYCNKKNA